jgi:hypothetical protein
MLPSVELAHPSGRVHRQKATHRRYAWFHKCSSLYIFKILWDCCPPPLLFSLFPPPLRRCWQQSD